MHSPALVERKGVTLFYRASEVADTYKVDDPARDTTTARSAMSTVMPWGLKISCKDALR